MKGLQLVSEALFSEVLERAHQSPRLRTNHNFHQSLEDSLHRFLNVMVRGTYVQPHRHLDPPKNESFLALKGQLALCLFEDDGAVAETHIIGAGPFGDPQKVCWGLDLAPGIWHTVIVLTPDAVCYEVKDGPYQKATDKDFAPWAPPEWSPHAGEYFLATIPHPHSR